MVLRESRILAVRSHAKLVAGGGYDARLMESQRQGYLGEPGGPEGRAA